MTTRTMCLGIMLLAAAGCRGKHDGGGFGGGGGGGNGDPTATLNENLELPPGSYQVTDPGTDTTIEIPGGSATPPPGGVMATQPGDMMNIAIPFSAPNGNVVAGGIRFGTSGPVNVVPIAGAQGQTSGSLQFQVGIPASVCGNLSSICHNIICYEFAVTDAGTISRANINSIALQCGQCDEPSCQQLLMDCDDTCGPTDFDCGDGATCVLASQVCNGSSDCPGGSDEDPGICGDPGNCCAATNGCPGETGSSCADSCCCCGSGEACTSASGTCGPSS